MSGQREIRARLPHRFPMLLVDRLVDVVPGERLTALKAVTCNEPWYEKLGPHHPDEDFAYPPSLLVESWCQAAGVLATWDDPNPDVLQGQVMLFGAMTGVEFHRPVLPAEVLEHRVRLDRRIDDTLLFEGDSRSAGETVMTVGRIVMTFRPAESLRPAATAG
ncbi:3-hydroxyacyl-ACP dehydratase FabZ family protein [Streptomyces sp. NPDC087866]|uniref:3-hydroxyacyl-ACP dehydratase FabZ family protein n=1 Tax=unclassified Streptomyces TaxID=2593676 RepID=UPI0011CE7FA8|nr:MULTISPECIES: beta-hydroxyacyl-ACP dehydratase [unclassified Streptomyces]MCX4446064.1 beta-hydroxyacyl-ACP dehydratase [Streptomyces sp. NBC_01789]TXS06429.1 beta-hydroxyacyl-ACP dehydratase [Streptomyces sp. col6]